MTCPHGTISLPRLAGRYQVVLCANADAWPDWVMHMTMVEPKRKITDQWHCERCALRAKKVA